MKMKLAILALVIVAIAGGLFITRSRNSVSFEAGAGSALSEDEIADVVAGVRAHLVLPDDEIPLIATITDVDALVAVQPFYRGAENGDLLIIYQSISKAIIYDADDDVLVNVGPVVFDTDDDQTSASESESADESVEDSSEE